MKATFLKPIACCVSLLLIVFCSALPANAGVTPIQSRDASSPAQKAEARTISGVVLDAQTWMESIPLRLLHRQRNSQSLL